MLSAIRKRLQSILACLFVLKTFDNRPKQALPSKIGRKKEEVPRKAKRIVNVWDSPFGKMMLDPDSSLESTTAGKLFRLRVRVPFSVFQMIVERFRTIPEWNIRKDSDTKRGKPLPLELKVMSSLYILGRAATLSVTVMWTCGHVDNIMFTCCVLHNILLDHDAREWTVQDDKEDVNLPTAHNSMAGSSDPTDFSYMGGLENNIPAEECESESTWSTLRSYLITHYKYAKHNNLLRWISYKKQI